MPRRPGRHSRRAGAHTALTAMTFGKQGIQARIRPVSSAILDFVENRLHKILRPARNSPGKCSGCRLFRKSQRVLHSRDSFRFTYFGGFVYHSHLPAMILDSCQCSPACEYPMVMIFAAFRTHLRLLPGILLSGIIIASVISAPDFPPAGQNVGQNQAVAQALHPQTIFLTKQVVCLFTV